MPADCPDARVRHLDGLRAVAALWVVGNHISLTVYPQVGGPGNTRGLLGAVTDWMAYGHFAVVAFIVLSGYSLALAYTDGHHGMTLSPAAFLRRRFVRIVLPYWGALAVSAVLATTVLRSTTGTHWDSAIPVTGRGLVLHALLLQDFATTAQINHALWSIAIEWHIYLLFAPLLWLRRRVGLLPATAVVVGAGVAASALFDGGLTLWAEANLVGCFALGVAAHEVSTRAGRFTNGACRRWLGLTTTLAAATVILCWCLGTLRASSQSNTVLEPLAGLITAGVLIVLAQPGSTVAGRALARALSMRWLARTGAFSYSIYLIHAPVLQLVWQYVMRPLGLPLHDAWALATLLILGLPASMAAGRVFYRLVERRCLSQPLHRIPPDLRQPAGPRSLS